MRRTLTLSLCVLLAAGPAGAAKRQPQAFYGEKQLTTSREAFARAEQRLLAVQPGMPVKEFFETMNTAVLMLKGKPVDLALDGFLPGTLKRDGQVATVLFGWREDGKDHPVYRVSFRDGQVAAIERLDASPLSQASLPSR